MSAGSCVLSSLAHWGEIRLRRREPDGILLLQPVQISPRCRRTVSMEVVMKGMFPKMYRSALVALSFAVLPVFLPAQGHDENSAPVRYSTASLCGNYGAIATYGANVARALGF